MKDYDIIEADTLKYETIINFPRIVADKYKYQDIEMIVYRIQSFYGGCYYEKTTYDKDVAISKLEKLNNEYQLK